MKQKLILITGSPCVGKTTIADLLFESYENSAFFDGDWAWCVNPFSVQDPRLRNGDKVMSYALSNYLNSGFDYVFFSSVVILAEDGIRQGILENITADDYQLIAFTLKCSEETLAQRHRKRGDKGEVLYHWLRLPPHPGDHVIWTDSKSPGKSCRRCGRSLPGTTDAYSFSSPGQQRLSTASARHTAPGMG